MERWYTSRPKQGGIEMIQQVIKDAQEVLIKIDNVIDDLEGGNNFSGILELQDLLLEWNLIGHNFATNGIQDYVKSENVQEEK